MSRSLNRRDLLKLLATTPFIKWQWPTPTGPAIPPPQGQTSPNILILVFDTLSARHLSLHGYPRQTTPNLARFAERALVYHRHYAGGNFTTPGTASLLTGSYPWSHRAFNNLGTVIPEYIGRDMFAAFDSQGYYRVAYTHNPHAALLLNQFRGAIDFLKPFESLFLTNEVYSYDFFSRDINTALVSEDLIFFRDQRQPASLFFSLFDQLWHNANRKQIQQNYGAEFPLGFPMVGDDFNPFRVEDTVDWLVEELRQAPQPFLAYCHMLPPHEPYRPRQEFLGLFQDDWQPPPKSFHFFSQYLAQKGLDQRRLMYDRYIAYVDAEFGRLYEALQQANLLDNIYVIVTSDHGQMFERGIHGHITQTLYEPVIHVPLLISKPGQQERQDVDRVTSATDLLPTLLYIIGQERPDWLEGQVLQFFDAQAPQKRLQNVFVIEGKVNFKYRPLIAGTIALLTNRYKLIYYFGYRDYHDITELYDLENDPEELNDLSMLEPAITASMRATVLEKLQAVNRPYQG